MERMNCESAVCHWQKKQKSEWTTVSWFSGMQLRLEERSHDLWEQIGTHMWRMGSKRAWRKKNEWIIEQGRMIHCQKKRTEVSDRQCSVNWMRNWVAKTIKWNEEWDSWIRRKWMKQMDSHILTTRQNKWSWNMENEVNNGLKQDC